MDNSMISTMTAADGTAQYFDYFIIIYFLLYSSYFVSFIIWNYKIVEFILCYIFDFFLI